MAGAPATRTVLAIRKTTGCPGFPLTAMELPPFIRAAEPIGLVEREFEDAGTSAVVYETEPARRVERYVLQISPENQSPGPIQRPVCGNVVFAQRDGHVGIVHRVELLPRRMHGAAETDASFRLLIWALSRLGNHYYGAIPAEYLFPEARGSEVKRFATVYSSYH